jgi:hypothetical protein
VVLLDAGYDNHTNLRTELGALGLSYAAGILSSTSVSAPGPPKRDVAQPVPQFCTVACLVAWEFLAGFGAADQALGRRTVMASMPLSGMERRLPLV